MNGKNHALAAAQRIVRDRDRAFARRDRVTFLPRGRAAFAVYALAFVIYAGSVLYCLATDPSPRDAVTRDPNTADLVR